MTMPTDDRRRQQIAKLIDPRHIAVVGASADPTKFGSRTLRLLAAYGFGGEVFAVNPSHTSLHGRPCFPSVGDLPVVPDVAVIALPAPQVLRAVREACEAGVGALVVYAGGFAETGPSGMVAQAELAAVTSEFGAVLCGPNAQGIANFHTGAVSSFSNSLVDSEVRQGTVAIVAQSGAGGGVVLKHLVDAGIGVGLLAATGNESSVQTADIVEHLAGADRIDSVLLFIEAVRAGPAFVRAARAMQVAE
jgi:acyl-CoA synthetase (NDP forming)